MRFELTTAANEATTMQSPDEARVTGGAPSTSYADVLLADVPSANELIPNVVLDPVPPNGILVNRKPSQPLSAEPSQRRQSKYSAGLGGGTDEATLDARKMSFALQVAFAEETYKEDGHSVRSDVSLASHDHRAR